jgi:hypothetical protein
LNSNFNLLLNIVGINAKRPRLAPRPFAIFAASCGEQLGFRLFTGDSHRKSGVFSFRSLLSPVDSSLPPEL